MKKESSFNIGGIELNYAESGIQGKPVMVFLHGLTGNWQAYIEDIEAYEPDWHIFALDLRGHGKSSKPAEGYLIPEYAGDVIDFLRQKAGGPVVLVGHSLGALVTLTVAARAPDLLRALIANDPPLLGEDLCIDDYPGAKMWFSWVYQTMKTKPSFEQLLDACKALNPDAGETDLQSTAQQVSGVAPGTVHVALEDRLKEGLDWHEVFHQIKCPVLLLYGDFESGSVVREQDAREFQRMVPHAVVRKVPGGSHGLWWEQPETTRRLVKEFLNSI